MKKSFLLIPVLAVVVFLPSFSKKEKELPKAVKTIVIDPGHGGIDPGAPGTFSTEANVSLSVSLKLGAAIQKEFPDIKIIYTRTTDVLPGNKPTKDAALIYRADLANESKGDLFIAVHCNAAGRAPGGWYGKRVSHYTTTTKKVKVKKKWVTKTVKVPVHETYWIENKARGTETYVWAVGKNDAKIKSVSKNTDFNEDEYTGEIDSTSTIKLPDPSDPAEKARMLVYAQNYFRKSLSLADLIQQEFAKTGRVDRGVKQRNDKGIWVLQATGMPSVLVEIGFISNKEEEEYINSDKGQEEIVNNIVTAFRTYKEKYEQKAIVSE
ncbi:MAG: N-acetylmuramoyl-L-alanine amidase [Bacteroidota bacterium]